LQTELPGQTRLKGMVTRMPLNTNRGVNRLSRFPEWPYVPKEEGFCFDARDQQNFF
jgi:hypothetical protein